MSVAQPIAVRGAEGVTVSIADDAYTARTTAIEDAAFVTMVNSPFGAEQAASALRSLKSISKSVEDCRKQIKAPVLDLGRKIDATAEEFLRDVVAHEKRLGGLLSDYEVAKRREAEAAERARQEEDRKQREEEEKRQAELRRIEEQARRKAEEAERVARHAENAGAAEAARKASEQAERARVDAESARLAAEESARVAEAQRKHAISVPARTAGTVVRDNWTFELTDINALFAARPELCEILPLRPAIIGQIRQGVREIPGLRIFNNVSVGVR